MGALTVGAVFRLHGHHLRERVTSGKPRCLPDHASHRVAFEAYACLAVVGGGHHAVLVVAVFLPASVMVGGGKHTPHRVVGVGGRASLRPLHERDASVAVPAVPALDAAVVPFHRDVARKVASEQIAASCLVDDLAQAVHAVVAEAHAVTGFLAPCHAADRVVAHAHVAVGVTCIGYAVVAVVAELDDVAVAGLYAAQAVEAVVGVVFRAQTGGAAFGEPAPGVVPPFSEHPAVLVP